jgi:hypothetical protein
MRFEVFMVMRKRTVVFWVVTPEDGGDIFL